MRSPACEPSAPESNIGATAIRVVGYLVRPRDLASRHFPVIIFNRGGFLDRGKIESFNLVDFTRLSGEGFVVLASQYRGNDGGEGREELRGTDLDDVSNLLATARSLPYTDATNILPRPGNLWVTCAPYRFVFDGSG